MEKLASRLCKKILHSTHVYEHGPCWKACHKSIWTWFMESFRAADGVSNRCCLVSWIQLPSINVAAINVDQMASCCGIKICWHLLGLRLPKSHIVLSGNNSEITIFSSKRKWTILAAVMLFYDFFGFFSFYGFYQKSKKCFSNQSSWFRFLIHMFKDAFLKSHVTVNHICSWHTSISNSYGKLSTPHTRILRIKKNFREMCSIIIYYSGAAWCKVYSCDGLIRFCWNFNAFSS